MCILVLNNCGVFCFFPVIIFDLSFLCLESSRVEWPQSIYLQSHSDMLSIIQKSRDCSVLRPCEGPQLFSAWNAHPCLCHISSLWLSSCYFFVKNFSITTSIISSNPFICPSFSRNWELLENRGWVGYISHPLLNFVISACSTFSEWAINGCIFLWLRKSKSTGCYFDFSKTN